MTSPKDSESDISINPLLSRLLSKDAEACVFRGYIGPSDKEGFIRLYPSLGCLQLSVEISVDDIVETAPAPTTMLPHDGKVVWVRSDAEVVFHGDSVTTVPVRSLRRPLAKFTDELISTETSQAANYVDIARGRLKMSVPALGVERQGQCNVCASCRGCASCTSVCQSGMA